MALNIKPLHDKVLIEPLAGNTQTGTGIFIPDNAKEKTKKGKVIAVGSGTKNHEMTVNVGDTVLYSDLIETDKGKVEKVEIKLEGKSYLIMKETDILAILS